MSRNQISATALVLWPISLFCQPSLPVEKAASARAAAERIRIRMTRAAQDIIEVGRDFADQKRALGHGNFLPWIESEFAMSEWTARNFMNVHEKFGKSGIIPDLNPTALYALAAPSTPEPVRTEVLERAATGEKVSVRPPQEKPVSRPGRVGEGRPGRADRASRWG